MRRPKTPAARRALGAFDAAGRGDRLHVWLRWMTCPFDAVERQVPRRGRILEVGCGHGLLSLYLAAGSPAREVIGIDIDADKIDRARRAALAADLEAQARFEVSSLARWDQDDFDTVVIADVLYLLEPDDRRAVLADSVARLGAGGRVVIKEADRVPRWKATLTVAQELVSTRVLRITEGDQVDFTPVAELARPLSEAGLEVTTRRVDRGYLHPHVLVVAVSAVAGAAP